MAIQNDLKELLKAEIITQDIADRIEQYYANKKPQNSNRILTIFGVLGALLVGLGTILILAHNWDQFNRLTKTILAFLPLLIGQGACAYTLLKQRNSPVWREASATFLFFAIGSSISLVSQIYNISGEYAGFFFSWSLLALPLVYLMRSSAVSIFYLVGIVAYAHSLHWENFAAMSMPWLFWLLLAAALPHYYRLITQQAKGNFTIVHHWMYPLTIGIGFTAFIGTNGLVMVPATVSMFACFFLIGKLPYFENKNLFKNGYLIFGALGVIFTLLALSYDWFWRWLRDEEMYQYIEVNFISPEGLIALLLLITALLLAVWNFLKNKEMILAPMSYIAPVFSMLFIIGFYSGITTFLINVVIFLIGLANISKGIKKDHLGILNYGLVIIALQVTYRFFDSDISFVFRGLLFLLVGIGFFAGNYWIINQRKKNEAQ